MKHARDMIVNLNRVFVKSSTETPSPEPEGIPYRYYDELGVGEGFRFGGS